MKKVFLNFCSIVLFFIILTTNVPKALAMDTGLATEPISQILRENFLSNVDIQMIYSNERLDTLNCLDVNEDDLIAVGLSKTSESLRNRVLIYNTDGEFMYGYSFNCSGSFYLEWAGDNIIIYFARSDIAAEFDRNGQCIEVVKIKNTIENNSYWNNVIKANERKLGDNKYILKNDMGFLNFFATSYSMLVKQDSNGNETILYSVNSFFFIKMIIIIFVSLVFITVVITIVVRSLKRQRKKYLLSK